MSIYIKEVKIVNFKTHKNSRIKFSQGINVITGPNGSGKSNIIEAILFGLGERNPRRFRVTEFNQVINKSAKEKYMSVTLTINHNGVDYQFKRVITVDGKHKYYFNGRRVSRSTYLTELLKLGEEGFNYRYVPQGSVIAAAGMTPQELRKLIDDLLGITEYNERKARALINLKEARNKLDIVKSKAEVIRKNIENLFSQMIDYSRFTLINKALSLLKAAKYSEEISAINDEINRWNSKLMETEDKISKLINKRLSLEEKVKKLMHEKQKLEKEEEEVGGSTYRELLKKNSDLQLEIDKISAELTYLKKQLLDLNAKIKHSKNEINNLNEKIRMFEDNILKIQRENSELSKEKERIIVEIEKLRKQKSEIEEKLKSLKNEYEKLMKKPEKRIEKVVQKLSKILSTEERIDLLKEELNNTEKRRELIVKAQEELREYIREVKENLEKLNHQLNELKRKREEILQRIKDLKKEIKRAEDLLRYAEKEIIKLRVIEEYIPSFSGYKDANFIYEVAKNLGIKGVLGILSDKISGPKEIINALKLILGERWFSIIVKDEETAKSISEIALKYNKKIIITPLSMYSEKSSIEIPENSIINYINYPKYMEKLLTTFLGRVIVINDLTSAYENYMKGYDVVDRKLRFFTYMGEFHIGAKFLSRRGNVNITQIEEVLKDFRKMINLRKKDLNEEIQKRERLEKEIEEVKLEMKKLNEISSSAQKSVQLFGKLYETYYNRVKTLKERINQLSEEVKVRRKGILFKDLFESVFIEVEKEIERLRKERIDVEDKRKDLDNQLNLLNEVINSNIKRINEQRELINSVLSPQLNKRQEEINKYLEEKEKLAKIISEKIKLKREIKGELSESIKKTLEFENRIDKIKHRLSNINLKINKVNEALKRISDVIIALSNEKHEIKSKIEKLKFERRKREDEIESLGYKYPVKIYSNSILDKLINELSNELVQLGAVNPLAKGNYVSDIQPYKQYSLKMEEIKKEERAILKFIEEIDRLREKMLVDGLNMVNSAMNRIFRRIFEDGNINLELEDPENIDSGLNLVVEFKDKPRLPVASLSGGEKSIALATFLIAINSINKDTILLLDEIDAHVDPNNLDKFAKALREEAMGNQIIVVSLKPPIIEASENVTGVTIRNGISRVISLPKHLIKLRGEHE